MCRLEDQPDHVWSSDDLGNPIGSISTFMNDTLLDVLHMPIPRLDFAAAVPIDGFILCGGGQGNAGSSVDVFDCTMASIVTTSLGRARSALAAAGGGGVVIFAGGMCVARSSRNCAPQQHSQ